jgi:hypothetical protein
MNKAVHKTVLSIFFGSLLVIIASPLTAQVYKVVDEDGNVTFTDQAPADGSGPVELAPISVIEAPTYETKPAAADAESGEGAEEMTLQQLRRAYRDFAIVSPQQEESVWRPDGPIPVAWSVGNALQDGMQVTLYLDGKRYTSTTQPMIPIAGLDRGEHTLKAELRDKRNRVVSATDSITFFVRQPGLYNRARVGPGGGA